MNHEPCCQHCVEIGRQEERKRFLEITFNYVKRVPFGTELRAKFSELYRFLRNSR